MKKIFILVLAAFSFSSQSALAGGSMAPYIRATTASAKLGSTTQSANLTLSFCNKDHNSINQAVKLKIQSKPVKTNGKRPKSANAKTTIKNVTTDSNACGNATINISGKYNVKLKISEKEGGKNGWWTSWSGYWTTK